MCNFYSYMNAKNKVTAATDEMPKEAEAVACDGELDELLKYLKKEIPTEDSLEEYMAQDEGFKEEEHPRENKGGEHGGRFKTSNKTIAKEDDLNARNTAKYTPNEQKVILKRLNETQMTLGGQTKSIAAWVALCKRYEADYHDVCAEVKAGRKTHKDKKRAWIRANQLKSTLRNYTAKVIKDLIPKPVEKGYDLPKNPHDWTGRHDERD